MAGQTRIPATQHCSKEQCQASANAGNAVFALLPVSAWQHSSEHSLVTLMPDADGLAASARPHLVELNPCGEVKGTRLPARDTIVFDKACATSTWEGVAAAMEAGPAAGTKTEAAAEAAVQPSIVQKWSSGSIKTGKNLTCGCQACMSDNGRLCSIKRLLPLSPKPFSKHAGSQKKGDYWQRQKLTTSRE